MALRALTKSSSDVVISLQQDGTDVDILATVGDETMLLASFMADHLVFFMRNPEEQALFDGQLSFDEDGYLNVEK